ncbi:MAG: hutH, partial [Rhodoferax sp.]|nr:hutH [Rhodoferax sp.]
AALASENKSLAHPASVDSLPTSANQEDHVSMATFAARRLGDMVANTAVVVGIEAMGAAQGMELKRAPPLGTDVSSLPPEGLPAGLGRPGAGQRGLKSSPLVEAEFARIRERVAYLDQDRFLADDVEAMKQWALQSTWPAAVQEILPSHQGV